LTTFGIFWAVFRDVYVIAATLGFIYFIFLSKQYVLLLLLLLIVVVVVVVAFILILLCCIFVLYFCIVFVGGLDSHTVCDKHRGKEHY